VATITFKTVDNKKWETLTPPEKTVKEDKYAAVLDALEAGEIVEIPTADNKEAKGIRIAIGRKSKARGFSVQYRAEGNILYVKKNDQDVAPTKIKKEKAVV